MTVSEKIIQAAIKELPTGDLELNKLKRRLAKENKQPMPTKTKLLSVYHRLIKEKNINPSKRLETLLRRRAVRTLSGVSIITSLVKPYPCPGECVYCPLDERQPKSYLSEEPAAMRALMLKFSPYQQMARRLEALEQNGHPTDKIELIIKGGTWNSYPLPYQYWFILKSFEAANHAGRKYKEKNLLKLSETSDLAELRKELQNQQTINETAKHRVIGLTLETRPDCITKQSALEMREMGCTRLEIGVQHTNDKILKLIKRGHTNQESKDALKLLRNFGYKTDVHLMPQLPGSSAAQDLKMMLEIFSDPGFRPDMIKVYPCAVIKNSELYDWFKDGKYKAYNQHELLEMLKEFKTHVPRYCRISRLIRDIPEQYIEDGNKITNLRQTIQQQMAAAGKICKCLRCREVGHIFGRVKNEEVERIKKEGLPTLFIDEYTASGGKEYFLSFEDPNRLVVFAFCRLRIDPNGAPFKAYIRELHTYGQMLAIGDSDKTANQHKGLGKKLVQKAEEIAKQQNELELAVISGVGVRDYYRGLGYRLNKTYMAKKLV